MPSWRATAHLHLTAKPPAQEQYRRPRTPPTRLPYSGLVPDRFFALLDKIPISLYNSSVIALELPKFVSLGNHYDEKNPFPNAYAAFFVSNREPSGGARERPNNSLRSHCAKGGGCTTRFRLIRFNEES